MKQMSQYMKTELNKFGPNLFPTPIFKQETIKQESIKKEVPIEHPLLINPKTKTWYKWDNLLGTYLDSEIPINNK